MNTNYMLLASTYLESAMNNTHPFDSAAYAYLCRMASKQARIAALARLV